MKKKQKAEEAYYPEQEAAYAEDAAYAEEANYAEDATYTDNAAYYTEEAENAEVYYAEDPNSNYQVEDIHSKTWHYSEKVNKHTKHHTLTISKDRITHQVDLNEHSQKMRHRTDIKFANVFAVRSYFGISKNIKAFIFFLLIALAGIALAITGLANEENALLGSGIAAFVIFLIVAIIMFKKIKPAFMLEIQSYEPENPIKKNSLSYGSVKIDLSKKSPFLYYFLLVVFFIPFGLLYLLFFKGKGGTKYRFVMDEQIGFDVVDTVASILLD